MSEGQLEFVERLRKKPTTLQPGLDQLGEWVADGVCEATDGCTVEPDGFCEHGYPSWLLYLGLI